VSSLTLSLTIGQASSVEGEVLDCHLPAPLATRLACITSTQYTRNPQGFSRVYQINSCSSFIKPLRSRPSGNRVPLDIDPTLGAQRTKTLVDYCVPVPKKLPIRLHMPSTVLFYFACQMCCHDGIANIPNKLARQAHLETRRLKTLTDIC
jgi:hypothetical protein